MEFNENNNKNTVISKKNKAAASPKIKKGAISSKANYPLTAKKIKFKFIEPYNYRSFIIKNMNFLNYVHSEEKEIWITIKNYLIKKQEEDKFLLEKSIVGDTICHSLISNSNYVIKKSTKVILNKNNIKDFCDEDIINDRSLRAKYILLNNNNDYFNENNLKEYEIKKMKLNKDLCKKIAIENNIKISNNFIKKLRIIFIEVKPQLGLEFSEEKSYEKNNYYDYQIILIDPHHLFIPSQYHHLSYQDFSREKFKKLENECKISLFDA